MTPLKITKAMIWRISLPICVFLIFVAIYGVIDTVHREKTVKCPNLGPDVLKCDGDELELGHDVDKTDLVVLIQRGMELNKFRSVQVSHCTDITGIGLSLFRSSSLQSLAITYCGIKSLHAHSFHHTITIPSPYHTITILLPKLSQLDLSDNKISVIEEGALDAMEELESLHLDRNQLNLFMWRWLNKLLKLREISLSSNGMEKWTGFQANASAGIGGVRVLSSIRSINVGNNRLTGITPGLFAIAPNLEFLNVEKNRMQFIGIHVFKNAKNLKTLILRGNQLGTAYRDWFIPVPDICRWVQIDLEDNPWNCDQEMLQHFRTQEESNCNTGTMKHDELPAVVCSLPDNFKWHNLDINVADCVKNKYTSCSTPSSPASIVMYVLIPSVICIGICVTAFLLYKRYKNPLTVRHECENPMFDNGREAMVDNATNNVDRNEVLVSMQIISEASHESLDSIESKPMGSGHLDESDVVAHVHEAALGFEGVVSPDYASTSNGESPTLVSSCQIGSTTSTPATHSPNRYARNWKWEEPNINDIYDPAEDVFLLGNPRNCLTDSLLTIYATSGSNEISNGSSLDISDKCTRVSHDDSDDHFSTETSHAHTSNSSDYAQLGDSASTQARIRHAKGTLGKVDVSVQTEVAHSSFLGFGQHEKVPNESTRFEERPHLLGVHPTLARKMASSCPEITSLVHILSKQTAKLATQPSNISAMANAEDSASDRVDVSEVIQPLLVHNWQPGIEQPLPDLMRLSDESSLSFRTASLRSLREASSSGCDSAISSDGPESGGSN